MSGAMNPDNYWFGGPYPKGFQEMDPAYQDYYRGAINTTPWTNFSGNKSTQMRWNFEPMSYAEWKALTGGGNWGQTPTPTPTPTPSDNLLGLIKQSADPWGTYGQMGVNEPYLSNINQRFGWSPEGLAYPTQLQASPTWYNPPIVYPDVMTPNFKPKNTTTTSGTYPWTP